MNGLRKCGAYIQWNSIQPQRRIKFFVFRKYGWNWRTVLKLAIFRRSKVTCFLSYVEYRQMQQYNEKQARLRGGHT
jgi:hypothetical protein